MLVISRKENEAIRIEPVEGVDPSLTLSELFKEGPILLRLTHVGMRRVRIVIEAPSALRIMRTEGASAEREAAPHTADTEGAEPLRLRREAAR